MSAKASSPSPGRARYGTSMFKGSNRFHDPKPSPAKDISYGPPPGMADEVNKARYGRAWSQSSAPRFYNDELHRRPSTAGSEANYSLPTFVDAILKDKGHHGALFNSTSARFNGNEKLSKTVSGGVTSDNGTHVSEETYQAAGLADEVAKSKHNPVVRQTSARFPKQAESVCKGEPLANADPDSIAAVAARNSRRSSNATFGGTSARFREISSDGGLVSSRSRTDGAASLNASGNYGTIAAELAKGKDKGTWAREKTPRISGDGLATTVNLSQTQYLPPSTMLVDSRRVAKFSKGSARFHEPKRQGMADTVYNLPSFVDEILRR